MSKFNIFATLSFISFAALFVKVTARISVFATGIDDMDNETPIDNISSDTVNEIGGNYELENDNYEEDKATNEYKTHDNSTIESKYETYDSNRENQYQNTVNRQSRSSIVSGFEAKKSISEEDSKYDEIRQRAFDMYLKEKEKEKEKENKESQSGIKKFFGLFGSGRNESKSDGLKMNTDEDFDIDINVFNTPAYLRNKKNK